MLLTQGAYLRLHSLGVGPDPKLQVYIFLISGLYGSSIEEVVPYKTPDQAINRKPSKPKEKQHLLKKCTLNPTKDPYIVQGFEGILLTRTAL